MKNREWYFEEEFERMTKECGGGYVSARDVFKSLCTLILETAKRQNVNNISTSAGSLWRIRSDNDRYVANNDTTGYLEHVHVREDKNLYYTDTAATIIAIGNEKLIVYNRKRK